MHELGFAALGFAAAIPFTLLTVGLLARRKLRQMMRPDLRPKR